MEKNGADSRYLCYIKYSTKLTELLLVYNTTNITKRTLKLLSKHGFQVLEPERFTF